MYFAIILGIFPIFSAFGSETLDHGDTAWLLTSTLLVLMMTVPGLALFYGGMVRRKNILSTAGMSFFTAIIGTLLWFSIGYSLAFGEGSAYIGDFSNIFLSNVQLDSLSGTIPESLFVTFQMTFVIIAAAIVTGSFVDRIKFSAFLIFTPLWMLFVYIPVCHWVWGGGFLGHDGVLDFAGGTVVHITAGFSGLTAAVIIGPRYNYGRENMAPSNLIFTLTGASLLWVGWFGFNAGSSVSASSGAAFAMLVTQIAAAAGAFSWSVMEYIIHKKVSLLGALSGVIAGLVGITPAAGFVDPMGALFIGLLTGAGCFYCSTKLKHMLKYDDSLDAFGIHGAGGIIGALLTGVFASEAVGGTKGTLESFMTGEFTLMQLWLQFYGVIAAILISVVATSAILYLIKYTIGVRVSKEDEILGLDMSQHGEKLP